MIKRKNRDGQVWFLDFMVSILMFTILVATYYGYLESQTDNNEEIIESLLLDVRTATDALVSSGYPQNWTNDEVLRIGITDGDHRINQTKLDHFTAMDYNLTRKLFGTYSNYYFYIQYKNGSKKWLNNSGQYYGLNSSQPSAAYIVQSQRVLIDNRSIVVLNMHMWRSKA
ncbi:hypothetical protein COV93_01205 [Candidatus Woesearchaeota archaeon CG11_big_fil_rev_8_21_14_0_20_43_8]|nr:MAG: hypothetical protein COV93_01205 [Candidatus Woesearchaeota archaeon CG11_big_fil_rev_8_21_14_0_20_43_8]PIO05628.1 MAG: hypothetical protein COT47_03970 [Candidatus Woesearchaeota archaeon CG08_land_8_20_14_0_20_43_7]